MFEDLHWSQERKVLCVCQLFRDGRQMDCLGERGQHGLHLEPADQGDRPEADRTHGRGALHRVSPH